eukprot:UN03921
MIFEGKEADGDDSPGDECKLAVSGIPKSHLNTRLISDVRKYVFRDAPNRVFIDNDRIVAVFDSELPDSIVDGFNNEIKSLCKDTMYAADVKVERMSSPSKKGI